MKKLILTTYYLILLTVVSAKVLETVFRASVLVASQGTILELQSDQRTYRQRLLELQQQLAQATSLTKTVAPEKLAEYAPITAPIVVTLPTNVASR